MRENGMISMDEIDTSTTTLQGYYDGMDGPSERCDNKLIETSLRSMIANPFQYLWTHGRDKRGVGRSMLCVLEFSTLFSPITALWTLKALLLHHVWNSSPSHPIPGEDVTIQLALNCDKDVKKVSALNGK
jgi:hypothetical protein